MEELQPIIEIVEKLSMPGALALVAILFFKSPLPGALSDIFKRFAGNGAGIHEKRIGDLESVVAEYTGNHYTDVTKDIGALQRDQDKLWNELNSIKVDVAIIKTKLDERTHGKHS